LRRRLAPFLHPFRGGGVEAKPRRRGGLDHKATNQKSVARLKNPSGRRLRRCGVRRNR
jgi:hypothetical protein